MRNPFIILCMFILLLPACSKADQKGGETTGQSSGVRQIAAQPQEAVGFRTVTPQEAKQLINTKKGLVMIDVRTQQELVNGYIQGSHLVPLWPVMQGQLNLPKDTPLLVICAVGGRSYAAGQALVQWGFREVYNLKGGIDAWKMAGLPLQYR
ncbi:MAG: rhodanese-like domain-containing protein [Desulfobulbaceae bacterium]|nr:rhodanese-like domain-containing protein [Desulfobulbaceae bacterium]